MKTKKRILSVATISLCLVLLMCSLTGCGKYDKEISAEGVDFNFTIGEFNYFYYDIWKTYYTTSYEYEQEYGLSYGKIFTGYDFNLSPEKQELTEEDFEYFGITAENLGAEKPTWADYFRYNALLRVVYCKYIEAIAEAEGIAVTKEQKAEIDKTISSVKAEANIKEMEYDEYAQSKYGEFVTIQVLENSLKLSALADNYYEMLKVQLKKAISFDELNEQYKSNTEKYNVVTYRGYYITDKEYAEDFTNKIKDDNSFVKLVEQHYKDQETYDEHMDYDAYCLIQNNTRTAIAEVDERVEEWVFDENRKSGDKACIPLDQNNDGTDDTYYIAYMLEPEHQMNLDIADARVIQFNIDEDTDKAAALAEAQKVMKLYKENPTEENFIALAKKYSENETNSADGGLYEAVANDENYAEEFVRWIHDDSRKIGDVEILQVNDIYGIVYYVGNKGKSWMTTVKEDILNLKIAEFENKFIEDYARKFDITDKVLLEATEKQCALIETKI